MRISGKQMHKNFGICLSLEYRSFVLQTPCQRGGIEESAVMRHGQHAVSIIGDKGLGVYYSIASLCRISCMTYRNFLSFKLGDALRLENLAY